MFNLRCKSIAGLLLIIITIGDIILLNLKFLKMLIAKAIQNRFL